MTSLEEFRLATRSWLKENCPDGVRGPGPVAGGGSKVPIDADSALWLERCTQRGWTVPIWPTDYGGAGLSMDKYLILLDEMQRIKARPPLAGQGVAMIGPTLLEYGSEEQKLRHLPKIANGEVRWCQGYSEPGAGSDLASLQTRALLEGEQFVISGQKIWTSGAQHADWMFCLVRTDTKVPKHEGISLLLLPMDQPGVTVHPIKLISGDAFFCETFFDDAIARKEDLIGQLNRGWTIGKRLLQHERSGINTLAGGTIKPDPLALQKLFKQFRHDTDYDLLDRIVRFEMRKRAFRLTQSRTIAESDDGQAPGPQSSIFELCAANLEKEEADVKALTIGMNGLGWEGEGFDASEINMTRQWLSTKRRTIARGTDEIQRNIIAKRVLGLPD